MRYELRGAGYYASTVETSRQFIGYRLHGRVCMRYNSLSRGKVAEEARMPSVGNSDLK